MGPLVNDRLKALFHQSPQNLKDPAAASSSATPPPSPPSGSDGTSPPPASNYTRIIAATTAAAVGGIVLAPLLAPAALGIVGFSAAGPVAGEF